MDIKDEIVDQKALAKQKIASYNTSIPSSLSPISPSFLVDVMAMPSLSFQATAESRVAWPLQASSLKRSFFLSPLSRRPKGQQQAPRTRRSLAAAQQSSSTLLLQAARPSLNFFLQARGEGGAIDWNLSHVTANQRGARCNHECF